MDFTIDWVFPVGLGLLGTLLALFNWNTKTALVKIKKINTDRRFLSFTYLSDNPRTRSEFQIVPRDVYQLT